MKRLIVLAAMAATFVPGAAIAQQQDYRHRDRTDVGQDRHTARPDRRNLRGDRRELRRDRRARARHNRSAYVAPYRHWTYRPVTVGYRLQPSFYGSRYYITDYGAYHLHAPRHPWLPWIPYRDNLLPG